MLEPICAALPVQRQYLLPGNFCSQGESTHDEEPAQPLFAIPLTASDIGAILGYLSSLAIPGCWT